MTGQTAAGEQRERSRALHRGIATAVIARAVAMLSPLVLVPITLGYLGASTYAVWMSAASLTAMAAFADLGLGQGLMTLLPPLLARAELARARAAISAAYTLLAVVAVALAVLILIAGRFVEWAEVLGATDPRPQDSTVAVGCLLLFVVNVPLSLVVRVQYAAQQVGQANLWQTAGALAALVLASVGVLADLGALPVVLAAMAGPVISNLAASLWLFSRRPDLAPRPTLSGVRAHLPDLGSLGVGFLTLNAVMAVATNLDILLVSHFETAVQVVTFAVVMRLFNQLGSLISLVNVPLWPANADAMARGDVEWVRGTTRMMSRYSLLAVSGLSVPLVLLGAPVFEVWTGEDLAVSRLLLLGAAAWWLLLGGLSPRFMVQNSVGLLMPQLIGWSLYLTVSVPLKFWAVSHGASDLVPMIGALVALATVLPGCLVGYRRTLNGNLEAAVPSEL